VTPQKLAGLRPQTYEHPSDTTALDALTHNAGLETIIRKLNGWGYERLLRVQLTGSYLRASPDAFSDVHALLRQACDTLDLPIMPDLYLGGGSELNAVTAGVEKPLIMVYTGAAEALTEQELLFVIGHEVGHIKSGHVLYYQVAEYLPVIGEIIGSATFGLGQLVSAPIELALLHWKRMSEFTADRAGLLACQDADVALRTLMKLSGLPSKYYDSINTEDFLRQAKEFEAMDSEKLTLLAKWLSVMGATHPWTVMRAKQLLEWVDGGGYEKALQSPSGQGTFCTNCGWARRGNAAFCPGCGLPFAPPKVASAQG
jgi:Zn-dependent protease with chaperone function